MFAIYHDIFPTYLNIFWFPDRLFAPIIISNLFSRFSIWQTDSKIARNEKRWCRHWNICSQRFKDSKGWKKIMPTLKDSQQSLFTFLSVAKSSCLCLIVHPAKICFLWNIKFLNFWKIWSSWLGSGWELFALTRSSQPYNCVLLSFQWHWWSIQEKVSISRQLSQ